MVVAIICTMTQERKLCEPVPSLSGVCCAPLDRLFEPELFKALADPSRVALLARLAAAGREATVGELAACCPTDLSVVSRHLAVLRSAGVLAAEKRGRSVHYRVRYGELSRALRAMADAIDACCPDGDAEAGGETKKNQEVTA